MSLSRSLLRRIAWLRRDRCGALLAALCLFILINPLVAGSCWHCSPSMPLPPTGSACSGCVR